MYKIHSINPNEIFIILFNDRPMVDPQGQVLIFYRRIDVERFINEIPI